MSWTYHQRSGELLHGEQSIAIGYSGFGSAKNDPDSQRVAGLGPIPRGAYLLGSLSESEEHGPLAIHLVPLTGTDTFGRSGFLCHGDNKEAPGTASHGCIILPRAIREVMIDSPDKQILVVA